MAKNPQNSLFNFYTKSVSSFKNFRANRIKIFKRHVFGNYTIVSRVNICSEEIVKLHSLTLLQSYF